MSGQRQRVRIAHALALSPKLIVANEATSALDVNAQVRVLDPFAEPQETEGLSYLFISHDLAVVERMAHRVAVIHAGRIVEGGSLEAILRGPTKAYTERLIAAVPVLLDPSRSHRRAARAIA